jgi:hypothetical protein
MNPVLFLDIDGVLNSRECWDRLKGHRHKIDRTKVHLLNEVVAATGCRVTVSSTWRRDSRCRDILREYGFRGRFCRDWRTIQLEAPHTDAAGIYTWFAEHPHVRGEEIADWLRRNPVERYAIVDDDGDMLPEQQPFFVQTTFDLGLTQACAHSLIDILNPGTTRKAA